MFGLNNKIAMVTGAAKGIGKGIAEVLARAGAVVVIADIDEAAGAQTAKELGGSYIRLDITDRSSCRTAVEKVVKDNGRIDILCSNAGIYPQTSLSELSEEEWDRVLTVNLKSMFFMVQAAQTHMSKQNYGRIVITSSITGPVTGFPGWTHYGASKAGQLGFMRSAALEFAKEGITINAVMPGNILTEGLKEQGEIYLAQMKAAVPTHTLGDPEDIGHAVCFLASDEARYITGQTIIVDGGQILPESPEAIL